MDEKSRWNKYWIKYWSRDDIVSKRWQMQRQMISCQVERVGVPHQKSMMDDIKGKRGEKEGRRDDGIVGGERHQAKPLYEMVGATLKTSWSTPGINKVLGLPTAKYSNHNNLFQ